MGRRPELRDLRSLERRGLSAIFPPLDVNERLPREQLLAERRRRRLDRYRALTLVGALYLPVLILMILVLAGFGLNPTLAFGLAGVVLAGVYVYTIAVRDH